MPHVLSFAHMNIRAVAALTLLVPPLLAGSLRADEPATLPLGSRLRILADQEFVGRLIAQDEQTLTLEIKRRRARAVVPRSAIIRVERSLHPSKKSTGALSGAMFGALSAVMLGFVVGDDCSGRHGVDTLCFPRSGVALVSAIGLVPLGAAVGAVVAPGERWEQISVSRFGVGVAPVHGRGVAVSAVLRF